MPISKREQAIYENVINSVINDSDKWGLIRDYYLKCGNITVSIGQECDFKYYLSNIWSKRESEFLPFSISFKKGKEEETIYIRNIGEEKYGICLNIIREKQKLDKLKKEEQAISFIESVVNESLK